MERRARTTSGVKLGLLLPFSGPYKALGEELYSGVQMANEAAGQPFDLVLADTGMDFGELPINTDAVGSISEHPGSGLVRVVQSAQLGRTGCQSDYWSAL